MKILSRICFVLALALLASIASAQSLKIGSPNTAFADPPVPRPRTQPCVVTLFKQFKFADFNPKSFNYTPPEGCPGPWAKVILSANFSITAGRQFDRTANIWIGPTNIYFGTTAEPSHNVARRWHVERDLTDYSSILTAAQQGTVDLGNLVDQTYTSVLHGTAKLLFYPLAPNQAAPVTADQVIGFSAGPTGGTVALNTTTDLLEQTLTLPQNIQRAYFDVFAQSQSNDEFWYTCVPDDVADELFSCPGTAFRESEVTIDGTPAGVAPVYPWIYTGGIDPYLWRPIPGVQTMNFQPYRVDLTPFAGMLDNGQAHTVALSVFNADSYFSATASLLLYLDHNATQLSGAVTKNTLAVPDPNIVENLHVAPNGNLHGSVNTRSGHRFAISGYVNTSSGPVTTTLNQTINFSNLQSFKITANVYQQDIKQDTAIQSITTSKSSAGSTVQTVRYDWPLQLDLVELINPDGSGTLTTTIDQAFEQDTSIRLKGQVTYFSVVRNEVTPADTLDFDSSGNITGNQSQSSAQTYFSADSSGYCYSRSITAGSGVLTGVTDGVGCK